MASIDKRPNGSYRARYRDPDGKQHARHFTRKKDAQAFLDEVGVDLRSGRYVDPRAGKVTLRAWFDEWASRQVWEAGTVETATLAVESTPFIDMEVSRIRPGHVQEWVKSMTRPRPGRPDGLQPSTIRTRFNYVHMCFLAAVKERLIGLDPSEDVKLPRVRRQEVAMMIPTAEQVGEALEAADPYFRQFIAVCAFAGLRLGEAAGLQIDDVDFLRRSIAVRRQVQGNTNTGTIVKLPKQGSERDVYVPEALTDMLAAHLRDFGAWGDENWLFANGPYLFHRHTAADRWRRLRKRVGLDEFTLHDLRHFFASGLIAAGCDVVTVQRAMGHSSPSITLNTYSHLWPTAEDKTRTAAAGLMDSVLNRSEDYLRTHSTSAP